jgi:hypothetical protein
LVGNGAEGVTVIAGGTDVWVKFDGADGGLLGKLGEINCNN